MRRPVSTMRRKPVVEPPSSSSTTPSRNNLAIAADGSTSAAFVVTTYFGLGTQATFGGNLVINSTVGVAAGYPGPSPVTEVEDQSNVTFLAGNNFSGANIGVEIVGDVTATGASLVNGAFYWDGGVAFGDGDNDQLYFIGNQNHLFGDDGNDWLGVNGSNNALAGGDGDDIWIGASGDANTLDGQSGNDALFAVGNLNVLYGWTETTGSGSAASSIPLRRTRQRLDWCQRQFQQSARRRPRRYAVLDRDQFLYGEAGGDWVGCSGDDNFLFGGAGADYVAASGQYNVLDGGADNDTLFAGANAHDHATFAFLPGYGMDEAFNFVGAVGDKIDIRGWGIADYAALTPYLTDTAAGLKIAFDGANQLTIQDVHALDPSWLIYV